MEAASCSPRLRRVGFHRGDVPGCERRLVATTVRQAARSGLAAKQPTSAYARSLGAEECSRTTLWAGRSSAVAAADLPTDMSDEPVR